MTKKGLIVKYLNYHNGKDILFFTNEKKMKERALFVPDEKPEIITSAIHQIGSFYKGENKEVYIVHSDYSCTHCAL